MSLLHQYCHCVATYSCLVDEKFRKDCLNLLLEGSIEWDGLKEIGGASTI